MQPFPACLVSCYIIILVRIGASILGSRLKSKDPSSLFSLCVACLPYSSAPLTGTVQPIHPELADIGPA